MEEFLELTLTLLTASGAIALFIIIAIIISWIVFINMAMDISKNKKKINEIKEIESENNEILVAILNEIRKSNELKHSRVQAQQMESIETPKI